MFASKPLGSQSECISHYFHMKPYLLLSMILQFRIRHLPAYPSLMQLVKERPDAIFLDYACACKHWKDTFIPKYYSTESYQVGVDTRVAIADGYPVENVVASDLQKRTFY